MIGNYLRVMDNNISDNLTGVTYTSTRDGGTTTVETQDWIYMCPDYFKPRLDIKKCFELNRNLLIK